MMIKTFSHEVRSREEFEMIKITKQVQQDVAESGIQRGLAFVISLHTTTSIMINESLPCVEKDIEQTLERIIQQMGTMCIPICSPVTAPAAGMLRAI